MGIQLAIDRRCGDGDHARSTYLTSPEGGTRADTGDIEGAEWLMLQSASSVLELQPAPIWLVEICSTEHQPAGTTRNPNFMAMREPFLSRGYRAFKADASMKKNSAKELFDIGSGRQEGTGHNFIFRKS